MRKRSLTGNSNLIEKLISKPSKSKDECRFLVECLSGTSIYNISFEQLKIFENGSQLCQELCSHLYLISVKEKKLFTIPQNDNKGSYCMLLSGHSVLRKQGNTFDEENEGKLQIPVGTLLNSILDDADFVSTVTECLIIALPISPFIDLLKSAKFVCWKKYSSQIDSALSLSSGRESRKYIQSLCNQVKIRKFKKSEILLREGTKPLSMFIVSEGELELWSKNKNNNEVDPIDALKANNIDRGAVRNRDSKQILCLCSKGQAVGEGSLLNKKHILFYSVSCRSEYVVVLEVFPPLKFPSDKLLSEIYSTYLTKERFRQQRLKGKRNITPLTSLRFVELAKQENEKHFKSGSNQGNKHSNIFRLNKNISLVRSSIKVKLLEKGTKYGLEDEKKEARVGNFDSTQFNNLNWKRRALVINTNSLKERVNSGKQFRLAFNSPKSPSFKVTKMSLFKFQ